MFSSALLLQVSSRAGGSSARARSSRSKISSQASKREAGAGGGDDVTSWRDAPWNVPPASPPSSPNRSSSSSSNSEGEGLEVAPDGALASEKRAWSSS